MARSVLVLTAALFSSVLSSREPLQDPLAAQDTTELIARIDGIGIGFQEFGVALELERANSLYAPSTEEEIRSLLVKLLNARVLATAARERGLDRDPQVRFRIEAILRDALVRREVDSRIQLSDMNEAMIRSHYESHADDFAVPASLSVHHIFLAVGPSSGRTPEQTAQLAREVAQNARTSAPSLADFQSIVRRYSEDSRTRPRQGLLGAYKGNALTVALADGEIGSVLTAAWSLKRVGDVSDPIRTPSGFHVARLSGRRLERRRSLDECREEIRNRLYNERRQALLSELLDEVGASQPLRINSAALQRFVLQPAATPKSIPNGPPRLPGVGCIDGNGRIGGKGKDDAGSVRPMPRP